jgi:hypothetical protein
LAVDWFKCDGENGKVGDAPKLTKWSHAGMAAATAESRKFTAAIFTARLRPRLSNYRRPRCRELARQLNHWPGSATNE